MAIRIGIDLGSLSVKAALFSRDPADAPFFERHSGHPLFQSVRRVIAPGSPASWLAVTRYARIAGSPVKETRALLEQLISLMDGSSVGDVAGTGTGAALLNAAFGVSRQNEFRAL